MSKKQVVWMVLGALFLLLLGARVLADSSSVRIECLTEQTPQVLPGGKDPALAGKYSVPRKQVLLEITTATW
jgi:hypothetical protein